MGDFYLLQKKSEDRKYVCFIVTVVDPGTFNDVEGPNFHPFLLLTCFLVNFITGKFKYSSD